MNAPVFAESAQPSDVLAEITKLLQGRSEVWRVAVDATLESLVEVWLAGMAGQLDPKTVGLYRLYFSARLIPYFKTPRGIAQASIAEYSRKRLGLIKRTTLQKERSTLRGFLAWCHEQGHLASALELPPLPKRAAGTPSAVRRRGKATELSPEECAALIAALPEWGVGKDGERFPVRARFQFMHETTLRPATLSALSVPEHYSRGACTLRISDAIDKARFGREVPLTDAARAALDSVLPERGLIFGKHNSRSQLKKAARNALPPGKAKTFCAYDLRHARIAHLAETGNLPGVAYVAGHKRITTTAIYVKPGLRAANAVLGTTASASRQARENGTRMVRALADLTSVELRALQPPEAPEQLNVEWQVLVNALAEARAKEEQLCSERAANCRATSPRDDARLDDLVERIIGQREFSKQHELRKCVGCSLRRLCKSLDRLTNAGRITQIKAPSRLGGIRHIWRRNARDVELEAVAAE